MGLMLSILIVCVGVIEALSCYEHFQYGVLHCATNVYENVRRKSSIFLKYTPKRLKFLSEDSATECDEEPKNTFKPINFVHDSANNLQSSKTNSSGLNSVKKPTPIKGSTEGPTKKLGKEDKIQIVKNFLEKPERHRTTRSISMPQLIYTERDIELTQIIDSLAVEPIDEIGIKVEDINTEVLTKEFDKLFDEYERSLTDNKESKLDSLELNNNKSTADFKPFVKTNVCESIAAESDVVYYDRLRNPACFKKTTNGKSLNRSISCNFDGIKSANVSKTKSTDLNFPSDFTKLNDDSSTSDSFPNRLIFDESAICNKSNDKIFEDDTPPVEVIDETFEELFNDVCDELNESDMYEEIEDLLGEIEEDGITSLEAKPLKVTKVSEVPDGSRNFSLPRDEVPTIKSTLDDKTSENSVYVKAVEQLAQLITNESLNLNKIKNLIFEKLNNNHCNEKFCSPECGLMTHDMYIKLEPERNDNTPRESMKCGNDSPFCSLQKKSEVRSITKNSNLKNEDQQAVQESSRDTRLQEKQRDAFLTVERDNLPNVQYLVDQSENQKISSSALSKEISNLSENSKLETSCCKPDTFAFSSLKSGNEIKEILVEENKLEKLDAVEFLPSSTCKTEIIPIQEMEVSKNISDSKTTETGNEISLELQLQDSGKEIEHTQERVENENCFRLEEEMEDSRQKLKDHEQKPPHVKLEQSQKCSSSETQSDLHITTSYRNSDRLNKNADEPFEFQSRALLALEYKEGIKSEGNKISRTVQDIDNIEEPQSVYVTECVLETVDPIFKLRDEIEESGKTEEFEQIDAVTSNLDLVKEALHFKEVRSADFEGSPDKLSSDSKEDKNSNVAESSNVYDSNKETKATNSEPEAFWLIFSGEYTKAMSKDWHSGHFSCWQCDEALTGQRYVLRDDHPYCIKCYESVFANACEECNKIIGIDSKDLSYKDKHWHEACFLCNKCRVSLVDKQFGSKADKIYCGNCYDAQFASRCDGCGEIFRAGTKKMEYKTRQWHEKCFCCCVCKTPIGTKSFIPREQEIYCATCYEEKFATRCVKCNKIITSGGVTYKNEPWHRECFTCTNCNTSLAGQRFTSRDEKPYCADCFGELFAKRCTACSRPITGIGGTRFISFEDRHWHNDCFICASCKTSLVGRGFITDGDDIICPECAKQKLM